MERSEASQALHRFIMDIQENDKACSLCHKSFETRPQFLLHRISPSHVKKLKGFLLWDNFVVECLACKICISDLKQAQFHIQLPEHEDKLKYFIKKDSRAKFICESCGLSFGTLVGLEIHRTLPPHELAISSLNLPNFDKLVKDLGGMPPSSSEIIWNKFCKVCNEEYGRLDEFAFHLFSKLHISQLRESSCIVCKKDFIHASDRESHLASCKHESLICVSIQELLEKAKIAISSRKNGYLCMYCMIWCNSWPCFELHLLHSPHYKALLRKKTREPSCNILTINVAEENKCSCKKLTAVDWQSWIEEPSGLSGWCHSCGVILSSPDKVERHLEDHYTGKICQVGKLHLPVLIADMGSTKVFNCYTCLVSFKNEFFLIVHEALFQHHSRIGSEFSNEHHYWCTKCEMIAKVSSGEPLQLEEHSKKGGESDHASRYRQNGATLSMHGKSCEEAIGFQGDNNDALPHQPEKQAIDSVIASRIEEVESISRKDFVDCGNTSFSSHESHQAQDASEKMQRMTDTYCASESDIDVLRLGLGAVTSYVKSEDNSQQDSPSMLANECEKSSEKLTLSSEILHHAAIGIPIVAAAALSPSETLHEVLRSVATVTANALLATLPVFQGSYTSSLKNCTKRECEAGELEPDNKRLCMDLEAALRQGFKSLTAGGSSLFAHTFAGSNMQDTCDMPSCNHNLPNECRKAGTLQHDSNAGMLSSSNVLLDGKGTISDPVNGIVKSSVSLMAQNCQHVASVVVAAGILPHHLTAPLAVTGTANAANCALNEVRQDELAAASKHDTESMRSLKADNLGRPTHADMLGVNRVDDVVVQKTRLEVDSDKMKEHISVKEKTSMFSRADAISSSSTDTEDESENDSGCDEVFLDETHVKLVQTGNVFSDSEDSSDSKSESDY